MTKMRLKLFDVLKGIAILMVVMGHVVTYGIAGIDNSPTFILIGNIHMPLFFFISGYFTVRIRDHRYRMPDMKQRFLQLIVPMVVVSTLWVYYYPHLGLVKRLSPTLPGLWLDLWKNGYWFTPVLFMEIALYMLLAAICNRTMNRWLRKIIFLLPLPLLAALIHWLPNEVADLFSLLFVFIYYPAFTFGGWCGTHRDRFMEICRRPLYYNISLAVVIAIISVDFFIPSPPRLMGLTLQMILQIFLPIVAVGIFGPWCDAIHRPDSMASRAISFWCYLGRNSLEIYLIHYFLLFPLTWLRAPLRGMSLGFIPVTFSALVVALLIIAVCLAITRIAAPAIRPLGLARNITSENLTQET